MLPLNSFSKDFEEDKIYIKVGDEYKILDIEHDPFYKQLGPEYQKQLLFESQQYKTLHKEYYNIHKQVTDYFIGEYTETTDEDFQDVWEDFFYHWYWSDIYICYSEEVLNEEIESWKRENRLDINPDICKYRNPYRLFKLVKKLDHNVALYSSIYTGLIYEIDNKKIPMVWASANRGWNYFYWKNLIKDFIGFEQSFISIQKLANKRLIRRTKNTQSAQQEDGNLITLSPVFETNATDATLKNIYEPFNVAPPEIAKGIWDNALNWFMVKAGWLGWVQNMNDKKERLTTGENFKDLHAVSNIQYRNLKLLNEFGRRFGREYEGKTLNFNLSNWGEAQGIPQGEFSGEELDNIKGNEQHEVQTSESS